jgi:hypothetical protein
VLLQRLGVQVEVVKSAAECDYTELIRVEAVAPDGRVFSADGTLIGRGNNPRIVAINGRDVEVAAEGKLLVLENADVPGLVGTVGTILGKDCGHVVEPPHARRHRLHGGARRQRAEPRRPAGNQVQPGDQDGEVRAAVNAPRKISPLRV